MRKKVKTIYLAMLEMLKIGVFCGVLVKTHLLFAKKMSFLKKVGVNKGLLFEKTSYFWLEE